MITMKLLRNLLSFALVCTSILPAACTRQNTKQSANPTSIKVGYVPIADCLQLYVAQEKGLFTKQGLSVELVSLQSGTRIIEALLSNSLDVGISNVVTTMISHTKGVPIVGITGGPLETASRKTKALMVLNNSRISQPKDLAGKTVAVNALRNIEHVMLRQYLEKNEVPVDSVRVIEAPFPQMDGILKNGSADAVMAIEPYISLSRLNNTARILGHPYTDVRPRNIVSIYDVKEEWLQKNPETAKKFAAAIAEATDFINTNDAEARQILLKYTKLPAEVADKAFFPSRSIQAAMNTFLTGRTLLSVQDVSHVYPSVQNGKSVEALHKIAFEIPEGQFSSIVGKSGCGKTTLLKVIAGLLNPSSGRVFLDGEMVRGPLKSLAVVFQDYSKSLLPWKTVQDNVRLGLRSLVDLEETQKRERVDSYLELVGLIASAKKYPWQLSGGMQQRVAIARALARHPKLLLLDEPFGALDAPTRYSLEDHVLRITHDLGITVLMITHDIDEAVYMSDRVLVMSHDGRLDAVSSPNKGDIDLWLKLPDRNARDQITTRANSNFLHNRSLILQRLDYAQAPREEYVGLPT